MRAGVPLRYEEPSCVEDEGSADVYRDGLEMGDRRWEMVARYLPTLL